MIPRIFNIINNVIKKVFKILNRLILIQFIQFYDIFSNNMFDGNPNQLDFIIDLIEKTQKEIQVLDAIIMIFKNV